MSVRWVRTTRDEGKFFRSFVYSKSSLCTSLCLKIQIYCITYLTFTVPFKSNLSRLSPFVMSWTYVSTQSHQRTGPLWPEITFQRDNNNSITKDRFVTSDLVIDIWNINNICVKYFQITNIVKSLWKRMKKIKRKRR